MFRQKFKHEVKQLYGSLRNERNKEEKTEKDYWKKEVSFSEAKGLVAHDNIVPPDI